MGANWWYMVKRNKNVLRWVFDAWLWVRKDEEVKNIFRRMLIPCYFITNEWPFRKHQMLITYIRCFIAICMIDNPKENKTMKSNSIVKSYNLESSDTKREAKRSQRKTTTQRRVEGQMKSCGTNDVLPIPREIYFSGSAVLTPPNDILDIFPTSFIHLHNRLPKTVKKLVKSKISTQQTRPYIPENHGSQISLRPLFSVLLRFVFSWIQSEKPQKSQF